MDGRSRALRGRLACHCILIETDSELVLIDTGFGTQDVTVPRSRLSRFFLTLLDPEFRADMTAISQIQRLGFNPQDVRHIVLTHLDFDHAGGLDDFPQATIHMLDAERKSAVAQSTWLDRQRYRPQQWSGTRANWRMYEAGVGESWFGFECVRQLTGVPPDILLIPLRGHTFGHAGVAILDKRGWLLQAGDAYFYHEEMNLERPRCTPGLRFYQRMMEKDRPARLTNQERLRQLKRAHGAEVRITSSHDVVEFERLARHPAAQPATPALASDGAF